MEEMCNRPQENQVFGQLRNDCVVAQAAGVKGPYLVGSDKRAEVSGQILGKVRQIECEDGPVVFRVPNNEGNACCQSSTNALEWVCEECHTKITRPALSAGTNYAE